jgi:amidohydrolase
MEKISLNSNINIDTKKYQDLRRYLHQYPELSNKEFETKKYLLSYIKEFKNYEKCRIFEVSDSTGFWVDVEGSGKATSNSNDLIGIAFRTDLDALPLIEETGVEYQSKNVGVSHSCGHDGHMTIITCFLEYTLLRLERIPSNVMMRFLYQPAEEGGGGAKKMIKGGCLKGINEIYAIHNMTDFKLGEVGIKSGPIMASADFFEINIKGVGGHGSTPHLTRSPITIGSQIIVSLNQIVSQRIDSLNRCVISVGTFSSGNVGNVIPESAVIKGSIRTLDSENLKNIQNIIQETCLKIGEAYDSEAIARFDPPGFVTFNDKNLTENIVFNAIKKAGLSMTSEHLPLMGSEDYSQYQALIPGVMMMLGCKDENHTSYIHNPKYNYNDLATPFGVELYARIIEIRLGIEFVDK